MEVLAFQRFPYLFEDKTELGNTQYRILYSIVQGYKMDSETFNRCLNLREFSIVKGSLGAGQAYQEVVTSQWCP